MRRWAFLLGASTIACVCLPGCSSEVLREDGVGAAGDASDDESSSGGHDSGEQGPYGTPCSYLRGEVTVTSWQGDQDDGSYSKSAFSFETASNDVEQTGNDFDVLYAHDGFLVDTVTDDQSAIVDLGVVALEALPATIDLSSYPLASEGAQAVLDHTYWVRTLDSNTRQVAAFRVVELVPGVSATLDWARSLDPDAMTFPVKCL